MRFDLTAVDKGWANIACVALALYALLGAAVSFAGWALNFPHLTDWDRDGISIQPNTCVLLVMGGTALILYQLGRRRIVAALGGLIALCAGLTLVQYLTGLDFGFDRLLLFDREWGRRGTLIPGRMGPPASTSLTLLGLGLVLLASPHPAAVRNRRVVAAIGVLLCALMSFSLVGYVFGAAAFYAVPWLSTIALQTSSMLLALALALILSAPEHQPMRLLLSKSGTAALAWRVLPVVILLPPLMGWLRGEGQRLGLYDEGTGRALHALGLVAIMSALMWAGLTALHTRERRELESTTRLREILGSISDAFMTLDRDWRFVFLNEHALQRMGSGARIGMIGMHMWESFPSAVGNTAYVELHRAMAERISVDYEVFYEPWQRWFRDKAYPTADGGLAIYSQDITDRKLAEQSLQRNQQALTHLVESAPFGIYIVDSQFRIAQMNQASQDGAFVNVRPVIGRDFSEAMHILWPEDVATYVIANFRRTLETGEPFRSKDYIHPRADIEGVEAYEWELHRISLPDGEPGVVCYYFDSTRLRQAEQALVQSDRRKDEFLAMLAHELRNPLAPIRNAAEILWLISNDPARVRETSEIIVRQARHMTQLVDDLLDVSRVTRGLVTLDLQPVDLRSIVMAAVEQSLPLIDARQHRLQLDLRESAAWINGDRVRLVQIFSNLLNNAAKYTEPGGVISVNFVESPDRVEVEVTDTGEGIDAELLPQIFELFAQGKRAPDRTQGGLGIGLSLVRTLVQLHGGAVEAESVGRGRGSRFTVCLPRTRAPEEKSVAELPRSLSASATLRLLVVDDNVDAADSLAAVLEFDGHKVAKAHDAFEAIARAQSERFDAMLLDIGLPGIDGYELARRIRSLPEVDGGTLIAISGYGQEEDRKRATEAGFQHYLVKPVDFEALRTILSH